MLSCQFRALRRIEILSGTVARDIHRRDLWDKISIVATVTDHLAKITRTRREIGYRAIRVRSREGTAAASPISADHVCGRLLGNSVFLKGGARTLGSGDGKRRPECSGRRGTNRRERFVFRAA